MERSELSDAWGREELTTGEKLIAWDPLYQEQIRIISRVLGHCSLVGDLFTGFGNTAKVLTKKGITVHGIDISREALEYSRAKTGNSEKFKGVLANVYNLPYNNSLDGISSSAQTPDISRLAREVYKALKPGGVLALTFQNPAQLISYSEYMRERLIPIVSSFSKTETEILDRRAYLMRTRVGPRVSPMDFIHSLRREDMKVDLTPICGDMFSLVIATKL